ncbi:MAG: hypothetical protein HYS22_08900 [Deltaproteobacteria bacterium]|nr:hypothetical protein [Deltaproteobacteria bacterium]
MKETKEEWFVIQTKPKKETTVKKLLSGLSYDVFLPEIKSFTSTLHHKSQFLLKPLFPSYLFVKLPPSQNHHLKTINYTRGVRKILGSDEKPIPVSHEIVNFIRNRITSGEPLESHYCNREGVLVRVKKGLLKDLIGIIEKPINEQGRVKVLFKILQNQLRATLFCGNLELA